MVLKRFPPTLFLLLGSLPFFLYIPLLARSATTVRQASRTQYTGQLRGKALAIIAQHRHEEPITYINPTMRLASVAFQKGSWNVGYLTYGHDTPSSMKRYLVRLIAAESSGNEKTYYRRFTEYYTRENDEWVPARDATRETLLRDIREILRRENPPFGESYYLESFIDETKRDRAELLIFFLLGEFEYADEDAWRYVQGEQPSVAASDEFVFNEELARWMRW